MAIFYTDTASLGRLEVTGSTAMSGSSNVLHVKGSGSAILAISGSIGGLMEVSDLGSSSDLFVVSSGSIDLFKVSNNNSSQLLAVQSGNITILSVDTGSVVITGSLLVSASIASPTINALSNAISVVSNELSVAEAVVNNVSALAPGGAAQVGLQNAINALSNRISSIPGAASAQPTRYVSTANTRNTATLTGISGLTVSVSAGVIYEIHGKIMYSVSAATGTSFGMVWPTANRVAGQWIGGTSVNQTGASTFSTLAVGDFDTGDSNSAVWSAAVGAAGLHFIRVNGIIDVNTGGAVFPVADTSAATNTMVIARGSFFRVARIN